MFVSPITAPNGYDVITSMETVTKDGSYVEVDAPTDGPVEITITPR